MNYEDKLKLAKEALASGSYDKETIEYIFPELKESEDEKIRKEIIQSIQDNMCVIHKDKCLAWLEKQGENTPYSGISFDYNGHTWGMCAREGGVDILCDSQLIKHLEKRREQKPAEWSEEDEYQINTILHGLDLKRELYKKEGNQVEEKRYKTQYDWLKSLKDRVQPQPKQEWSEEDEERISRIADFIWKNRNWIYCWLLPSHARLLGEGL